MNRRLVGVGVGLLTLVMVSWAAVAWSQPGPGTPAETPPKVPELTPNLPDLPTVPGVTTSPSPRFSYPASVQTGGQFPGSQPIPPAPLDPPGTTPPSDTPPSYAPTSPTLPPLPSNPPLAPDAKSDTPIVANPELPKPPAKPMSPEPTPERPEQIDPELTSAFPGENQPGRQEPCVSLEWVGPLTAKVGQEIDYSLMVKNTGTVPVQQVLLRVQVPANIGVLSTTPKGVREGQLLGWDLGTLQPKQGAVLEFKMVCRAKGDAFPQAWVTFTGSSVAQIRVREPKLVLKASAPSKVLLGDAVAFNLSVSNPGDGVAEQVKIKALLSDGLEHARGNMVDFDIGNLNGGETRSVQVVCAAKCGGTQKCEGIAESTGGLKSTDSTTVNVIKPHLDLQLSGPGLRYLGRKAIYTLQITNPGDAPATNVTISHQVPAGFKVLAASDGGRHDFSTRSVSWFMGEIAPGKVHEVKLEVEAINSGSHVHRATAVGARGLRSEAEMATRVEGLSAIMLEMVDTDDPIEVNSQTSYEIHITNTGSKTENDIKLVAIIPDEMEFVGAQAPVRFRKDGKLVIFESLPKLDPRADVVFRINVKGKVPSIVRFEIRVTSANLIEPVIKMEPTRIYSDSPEATQIKRDAR